MDRRIFAASTAFATFAQWRRAFAAQPDIVVSDPIIKDNLAVYFLRGRSEDGPTPLTLQEAIAKGVVTVIETGDVNELLVENVGDEGVFIQSGEIVKGGKQDRVLTVSLMLPPKSGRMPIASFCVEQGRWSPRGKEDASRFAQAASAVSSRETKLAMRAASPRPADGRFDRRGETGARQQAVWASVARTQERLSSTLGDSVRSSQSQTSLQLALENDTLKKAQAGFAAAMRPAVEKGSDIIGYVFAVNGKINSGDVYQSNALFRKLWPKLIDAAAAEAIGEKDAAHAIPPSVDAVQTFLKAADNAPLQQKPLPAGIVMDTRDNDRAVVVEARSAKGGFFHRAYVAK